MDDQILRFLPEFYAKDDVDSALRHVVDALNNRLQEVRKDLLKVSYSHYVDFASTDVLDRSVEEDLDRIGALYSIKRLIERVSEQEEAAEAGLLREHRALLDRYRERLKATIRIFRDGIATARAIVETVAAVFDLDIVG
ncbi:MAG TPA: hypothetical protein VKA68_13655, partial [bacterium]|nr:hypothetical protein [bacterium]